MGGNATPESEIAATAEIVLKALRAALIQRDALKEYSCRYSARHSWIASESVREAIQNFFSTARSSFELLAQMPAESSSRGASASAQNRHHHVEVLGELATLYFDTFEDLTKQGECDDGFREEYENAKAIVFDMFSCLEDLHVAE